MPLKLPQKGPSPWWQKYSTPLIWLLLIVMFVVLPKLTMYEESSSYSLFKSELQKGSIKKVVMQGESLNYTTQDNKIHKTIIPPIGDDGLVKELMGSGVEFSAQSSEPGLMTSILINLLPWVLIIGFFFWSSRRINQGLGGKGMGPMLPGMSKTKELKPASSKTKFDDIAGLEGAKTDLMEIVDYLKSPENYSALGAKLPRGVLLMGPPGTGKTLIAKAVAGEAEVPFFSISGSEFIELYVGMGASRVRQLFEHARELAPSIIFIDEIDSIGRTRGTGLGGGHDEREQTLNQILAEMDGFQNEVPIVVMAATNRPDVLDPALVRPGRFDRQIMIDLPMKDAREKILKIHCRKVPVDSDVNFTHLAQVSSGFSGADLANLVNEAALMCARRKGKTVTAHDFSLARDKVLMGNPRETKLNDHDKKIVAYHEAGHALIALKSKHSDPVMKITILPRGRALGFTEQSPKEDRVNMSKSAIITNINVLLGGRASEKLIFQDVTTGAEDDLKRASKLARKMVMNWGMSEVLEAQAFESGEDHPFLGMEMTKPKNFSEKTAEIIDQEVSKILKQEMRNVEKLLDENRSLLDRLAQELLKHETLEKHQIDEIVGQVV